MQAIEHSLELILDPITKPDFSHECFLNVEKDSCKERHENNDINYSYNNCCYGLPIVNTALVIDQNDTRKLKGENDSTQSIHQSQVVKVLTNQEAVTANKDCRVHT